MNNLSLGTNWEDYVIPDSKSNNGVSATNRAKAGAETAKTNLEQSQTSTETGGSGQETMGLVRIEVNGEELPIFGKLSVEAINANTVNGDFTKIWKEAIAPTLKNNAQAKQVKR